ncbi:MAG: amidohydrolase family protein [Pseudomonadales bacterium]|nr:amidohydrolase family protein [Pseudomonadales bacterium]
MNNKTQDQNPISRRQLLAGAGAALGAGMLSPGFLAAQQPADGTGRSADTNPGRTIVFTHTTVVTNDAQRRTLLDVALAVQDGRIAAIGDTDEIMAQFPQAEVYDGSRKALLPGLINCHAHLAAALERGFNEDFGFPNSLQLPISPGSLISAEEATLMSVVAALEGIRSGTTTLVQNTGGIARDAAALAETGLRWVFAESVRDIETVDGPMSPPRLANSVPPTFSDRLRTEGMQRIADLHSEWHGRNNGKISVFPAAALTELSSPQLLRDVREFADRHDLGYTIHMTQSIAEVDFMLRYHGVRPALFLERHGFLGPRLFAAHARYCDATEIAALGNTRTIITHQAAMAANRGVSPPITALRAAGCPIALGTDNNNNDMLHVMKTAISLERIQRNDEIPGTLPQPEDMLADAAGGGAQAVNQARNLGSLEPGKKADLLVLDRMKPHLTPSGRILSAWIHNGQPSDIESVMVDGEFIMRDHRILTVDEAAIMEEAFAISERVWGRILRDGPLPLPQL